MDNTFFNILAFILITILYYVVLKPKLTMEILSNAASYKAYTKSTYFMLCVYFLLVLLVQFGVNSSVMINKCGGSVSQNIGFAGLLTFLPWVLIFGAVLIVLIIFPGFKGAFSDVIGYFYVSSKANSILTDLLMDTNIYDKIDQIDAAPQNANEVQMTTNPLTQTKGGDPKKKALQDVADVVIKLCGNMSILINQIVPSNFLQYMELLKPLMKPKYELDSALLLTKEQELLDVVTTRDNIGEAFWYTYTAILLISITQYNIASRPCTQDSATMKAKHKKFLDEQEIINKEKARGVGVYTITN